MVVEYLEKIREKFQEEQIQLCSELSMTNNELKENIEIIKVLEENHDPNFEGFTPRQVNGFNKRKLVELKEEQKVLEERISNLQKKKENIEKELEEVGLVIREAKCIF